MHIKNKNTIYIIILIIFILIYFWYRLVYKRNNKNIINLSNCNIQVSSKIMKDYSMEPIISIWASITLLDKYYNCLWNKPSVWDVIAYNFWWWKNYIIRKIMATSNDKIKIEKDKLFINWKIMKNSVWKEYIFSPWELKMIDSNLMNNRIQKWTYLIFADNIYEGIDSRRFGAVSDKDFLAKVEIK